MKKVLILAYDFPPYVSVGGLRPYSWYKYLKEYGIEPIVITRQWGNKYGNYLDYIAPGKSKETIIEQSDKGTIIRTPYKPNIANKIMLRYGANKFSWIRKAITGYFEIMQWVFNVGPKSGIYRGAGYYLKNHSVDCIIATGEPFVLFKYASKLSKDFKITWIADYRDPWNQSRTNHNNLFLREIKKYLEKTNVSTAIFVTSVSDYLNSQIATLIKNKKFYVIENGFDHEVFEGLGEIKQKEDVLNIAIVGTIYRWHPWKSVLSVLNQFIKKFPSYNICVNFYGINNNNEIKNYVLTNYPELFNHLSFFNKIPNEKYLIELAKNNAIILFNQYAYMGTKIYDYLGLKRTILLCYADDDEANVLKKKYFDVSINGKEKLPQADLIRETNSGIIVKDSKHLLEVLEAIYHEFQIKGRIECNSNGIEKYSRKIQTEKLAEIIKKVMQNEVIKSSDYHKNCMICNSPDIKNLKGFEENYLVKCNKCGFVFSERIPSDKELIDYYKKVYQRNDYLSPITIKRYNELLDEFEKYRKTNKILDIGSGIGYFLVEAKKRGWDVFGTELTEDSIQICKEKGIIMHQGVLNPDNYKPETFDVITSFEVIEHINYPKRELANIYQILRRGGVFYFSTPNFNSLERFYLSGKYSVVCFPEHLSYYTKKTISKLMSNDKFKKVKLTTTGYSLTRMKERRKGSDKVYVSETTEDEIIRTKIEKNILLKWIKHLINNFFTVLGIGNSLKGLYQKK